MSRLQFRRGTAAEWTAANPVLRAGEPGDETDTGQLKIGDGVTAWNDLDYISGSGGTPGAQGAAGPPGFPGEAGDDGIGYPGPKGDTGAQGTAGSAGAAGAAGAQGVPGPAWSGEDGEDGFALPGPTGATGAQGSTGSTGSQGIPGVSVPWAGEDGEDGFPLPGPTGATGAQGAQGNAGNTGSTGAQGVPGPPWAGEDGEGIGYPGPQGLRGQGAGLRWKFSTSVVDADPGAGFLRANNADLTLAGRFMVSETDADGGSAVGFLAESVSNTFWFLRGERSGVLAAALLLGTTDNGAWRDVIISSNEAVQAGPFLADEYVYVVATLGGASGNPGSTGAAGAAGPTVPWPGEDGDDAFWGVPGAAGAAGVAGAPTLTAFTQNLGIGFSGTFDLTGLSGLTANKPVLVQQSAAAISSKGNATDEPEMDLITATAYVLSTTSIRVYWNCPGLAVGTYAFTYLVGA